MTDGHDRHSNSQNTDNVLPAATIVVGGRLNVYNPTTAKTVTDTSLRE